MHRAARSATALDRARAAQRLPVRRTATATCSSPAASASPRSCRWCATRIRRGADWRFVYTGRSRASMPFLDELDRASTRPASTSGPTTSTACPTAPQILALAPTGAAALLLRAAADDRRDPRPRSRHDRTSAPLHYERFSPPPVVGGEPFEIELARSGQVVPVGADESALAAIRRVLPGRRRTRASRASAARVRAW